MRIIHSFSKEWCTLDLLTCSYMSSFSNVMWAIIIITIWSQNAKSLQNQTQATALHSPPPYLIRSICLLSDCGRNPKLGIKRPLLVLTLFWLCPHLNCPKFQFSSSVKWEWYVCVLPAFFHSVKGLWGLCTSYALCQNCQKQRTIVHSFTFRFYRPVRNRGIETRNYKTLCQELPVPWYSNSLFSTQHPQQPFKLISQITSLLCSKPLKWLWPTRVWVIWPSNLSSSPTAPSLPHPTYHIGLLVVSQTHQAQFSLRPLHWLAPYLECSSPRCQPGFLLGPFQAFAHLQLSRQVLLWSSYLQLKPHPCGSFWSALSPCSFSAFWYILHFIPYSAYCLSLLLECLLYKGRCFCLLCWYSVVPTTLFSMVDAK